MQQALSFGGANEGTCEGGMDFSLLFNILALMLSLTALVISALIALRQSTTMHHANELSVLVDLAQEFRTVEFQRAESYVIESLAKEQDPSLGCSRLPEEARIAVNAVMTFFSSIGTLVVMNMADEVLVVPLFGYRANRAWKALEPFVMRERELRGPNDGFGTFYEDLVCRIRDKFPLDKSYGLVLRRLPADPPQERPDDPTGESAPTPDDR
ncbi:hypothetical protein HII36_20150 [Nonomuraea sp. NN258]|uniref:DUF4760 domain-containing protein n=1 Tax=Nonomuraea antri TaxID=2730852 RepID=UPI00156983BA|nr:hypothetical protein [Nonomuraea antri]NRQ34145.1 hypothetical protein [Nonomuraea antri]